MSGSRFELQLGLTPRATATNRSAALAILLSFRGSLSWRLGVDSETAVAPINWPSHFNLRSESIEATVGISDSLDDLEAWEVGSRKTNPIKKLLQGHYFKNSIRAEK
ncbi:hypothetical protein B0H13DRAFT_1902033 [Mycena leptocephala]|nr:hypothetical protein B0H13DRAFT_1902033 [Mycena leptocephala]